MSNGEVLQSQRLTPTDNPQQNDHDGDYEQNVDKPAQRVGREQAQQPQNNEYDRNGIKHE